MPWKPQNPLPKHWHHQGSRDKGALALTMQKEVRHIIAALRGSGEHRWGAEEQHIDISAATAIPQAHLPCSEALLSSPERGQPCTTMAEAGVLPSPLWLGARSCYFVIVLGVISHWMGFVNLRKPYFIK